MAETLKVITIFVSRSDFAEIQKNEGLTSNPIEILCVHTKSFDNLAGIFYRERVSQKDKSHTNLFYELHFDLKRLFTSQFNAISII